MRWRTDSGLAAPKNRAMMLGPPCANTTLLDRPANTRKRLRLGETLVRAGGAFDSLFGVRSGFLKSSVVLEDGRDQVTGFHMAGEIVGMDGIASESHTTDVVALEDSEVCIIPYARLVEPDLQRELHKAMSRELVRDQGVMLLLGSMRPEERLAAFLLNLSQRFLARGFSSSEFRLRMTRCEIGSYLGLSLETVSRLFSRLHDVGLIRVQQKHVRIDDIPGLKAVMAGTSDRAAPGPAPIPSTPSAAPQKPMRRSAEAAASVAMSAMP